MYEAVKTAPTSRQDQIKMRGGDQRVHVFWLWCLSSFVFNTSVPTHNGNGLGGSPSTWKWDRMAIKMDVGLLFLCVCVCGY